MASERTMRLLTLNVGSSSLKAALYRLGSAETLEVRAAADRIGIPHSSFKVADARGAGLLERSDPLPDHAAALDALFPGPHPQPREGGRGPIGQRVVQGGSQYSAPT